MSTHKAQKPVCIACGACSYLVKRIDNGWDIYKCANCRLEFCRPMPDQDELDKYYNNYTDPRATRDIVAANAQRNIKNLSRYGLNGQKSLLDYGSGTGVFCEVGNSKNWIDYDPYSKDESKRTLANKTYDWVTLWGVFEHITAPISLVAELRQLLRVGGYLALTTVDTDTSIPYRHKPPEHVTYWTRQAMELAFAEPEWLICEYSPYKMVQNSDIYLNAVLRTVPDNLRAKITHEMPSMVEVPTNEVFVVIKRIA